jgi:hypothetical protein
MKKGKFILNDNQKIALDFYLYVRKDYDMVFEYLKKIGVDKDEYNDVIKQINS